MNVNQIKLWSFYSPFPPVIKLKQIYALNTRIAPQNWLYAGVSFTRMLHTVVSPVKHEQLNMQGSHELCSAAHTSSPYIALPVYYMLHVSSRRRSGTCGMTARWKNPKLGPRRKILKVAVRFGNSGASSKPPARVSEHPRRSCRKTGGCGGVILHRHEGWWNCYPQSPSDCKERKICQRTTGEGSVKQLESKQDEAEPQSKWDPGFRGTGRISALGGRKKAEWLSPCVAAVTCGLLHAVILRSAGSKPQSDNKARPKSGGS